jgi:ABC-type glycerol-3-phosphate transport system permease component
MSNILNHNRMPFDFGVSKSDYWDTQLYLSQGGGNLKDGLQDDCLSAYIDTTFEDCVVPFEGMYNLASMSQYKWIDSVNKGLILKNIGLTQAGAIPGLILVGVASSGMGYYVCKGFFDTIPKTLDEAARIDGASRARIFFTMLLPLSKPIIIYQALIAFMAPWCDYIFASYIAFGYSKSYNVAVGLYDWVNTNDYQGYFTRFCAGGVLIAVPITALFMSLQKYYVEGVTGGAVKG